MKKQYWTAVALCAALLLAASFVFGTWNPSSEKETLSVGFLYENDAGTPATYNFALAEQALRDVYGDHVVIYSDHNVQADGVEDPIRNLSHQGVEIIFTNSHSPLIAPLAAEFPNLQFCQLTLEEAPEIQPENYHTFSGETIQGSYVCGTAAGLKLRELLDAGEIAADQALVGFVCAFENPTALSDASAFMLGVLSQAPEARMRIRATRVWGNYTAEKAQTKALIAEGCLVIAQHTGTIGPAMACEEAWPDNKVYFFGLHQNMQDVAPTSFVTGYRVNYAPYVLSAVEALFSSQEIESVVSGNLRGPRDVSAGFAEGWIEMLELNDHLAAEGTLRQISRLAETLRSGQRIFQGDYTAVNPADPSDTLSLAQAYAEYSASSYPSFHYILDGYMTVE